MLQLAYISTSRQAVDQALLDDILASSRRNNESCGVTGLLVSGGKRFLQVLEGPDQAVLTTYARIQNDLRHFAFVVLATRPVTERAFGEWSMAYHQGGAAADGDLVKVVETLIVDIEDPNLRAQFSGFARLHARAA